MNSPANMVLNGNNYGSSKATDGFNEVKSLDEEIGINRPFQAPMETTVGDGAPNNCSTGS